MGSSPGFGSTICNFRPIQTRFPYGSAASLLNLAAYRNSLARSTKSTQSHFLIVLLLLVGIGFQVLFHSPSGVLFAFPSRYYSSIGHRLVFSLGRWSSLLPTGFLVSCGTLVHNCRVSLFRLQGFHLLWRNFPVPSAAFLLSLCCVLNPEGLTLRFGLFPFRSPLL